MKEQVSVLIEEERLAARVQELAAQINEEYAGKKIHLICILKGSVFFTCELAKYIKVPVTMDFMSVSSYGDGMTSLGYITINQDLTMDIKGREVLIIEDIVDSGICTLLDKPDKRVSDVEIYYTGFEIEDHFVVGFGLDYAQRYRNLPYIGALSLDEIG